MINWCEMASVGKYPRQGDECILERFSSVFHWRMIVEKPEEEEIQISTELISCAALRRSIAGISRTQKFTGEEI